MGGSGGRAHCEQVTCWDPSLTLFPLQAGALCDVLARTLAYRELGSVPGPSIDEETANNSFSVLSLLSPPRNRRPRARSYFQTHRKKALGQALSAEHRAEPACRMRLAPVLPTHDQTEPGG